MVFTVQMRKIREETTTVGGNGILSWDLKDRWGGEVANGVYFVKFTARDGAQVFRQIFKVIVAR